MFEERSNEWLADEGLDEGREYARVLFAGGDVRLSSEELAEMLVYPEAVCVVVQGDLEVRGAISVDEMHGLVVSGDVRCDSFWIGEGAFSASALTVTNVATFAVWGSDMEVFEATKMSAQVWCTPAEELPTGLSSVETAHVIETSDLDEEKLLSWIVDDSPAALCAALEAGEAIDDAWCLAHRELVKDPERRAHLGLETPDAP